jgi:hypothetical protein
MISSHPYVCGIVFYHFQDTMQYTRYGTIGFILSLVESSKPIEVAKKFVRSVNEVNDHEGVKIVKCNKGR